MNQHRSLFSCCSFLVLVLLLGCVPVWAQQSGDNPGGSWNDPASAAITNILMDKMTERRRQKRPAVRHSGTSAATPASSVRAPSTDASVRFRSTGTQLKTREVANLIAAGNAQVLTLLTKLLEEYEKSARAAGRPNDLALALSFFFATNASIYHDAGQPTDPQMLELRDVIAEALSEGNAFNGVTDRQKQEMYETLVLVTGFALAVYEEGKAGNAESLKLSQQLAGQNLLSLTGITPDKITFTDQGLNIEREPAAAAAPPAPRSVAAPASPNAAALTVNAGKLVIDFEGNEVRANQLYSGKRIRINGTVNSIEIMKDGRITLTFHSPAMGYAMTRCYFNKSQSARLAELSGGQEAIVEGTVRGLAGGRGFVEVENCVVP